MSSQKLPTTRQVLALWEKASIPTKQKYHVFAKIKLLYNQWIKLKKRLTNSETQKKRKQDFCNDFDHLFDVAHQNKLKIIKHQPVKDFLTKQRS